MIWFSFFCAFIMIPIGIWGSNLFIPATFMAQGQPYFMWIMIFGPFFPLVAALSAFFIGRGKVKIVTFSVIFGNIINLILVIAFVFGVPGFIAPLGSKGAAIATGIAETIVAVALFAIFLRPYYRKIYNTHHWQFNKELFIQCIKIGFPNAIGHMIATGAWAFVIFLMAQRGITHVTVISIGLSIWMLFSFITEGLQKGVTSMVSNHLGARRTDQVSKVFKTGLKLQIILAMVLAIPLVIMPGLLVDFFIPLAEEGSKDVTNLKALVEMSCRWLWVAYLFDGMAWIIDGILTAAGDTRFIMFMNSVGTWVFCILPIYFFVVKMEGSPILTFQLITVFCSILFACYFLRYQSKQWKKSSHYLMDQELSTI
jgi:MATE family multidrug resistance protein